LSTGWIFKRDILAAKILAAKTLGVPFMKKQANNDSHDPRLLTPDEIERLLKDAKESAAWMKAEIKRRRAAKYDDLTTE
jgi:cytochrome P450